MSKDFPSFVWMFALIPSAPGPGTTRESIYFRVVRKLLQHLRNSIRISIHLLIAFSDAPCYAICVFSITLDASIRTGPNS